MALKYNAEVLVKIPILLTVSLMATSVAVWANWKSSYDLDPELRHLAYFSLVVPIVVIFIAFFKLLVFFRKPFISRLIYFLASIAVLIVPILIFSKLPLPINSDGFMERMNNYSGPGYHAFAAEIRDLAKGLDPADFNYDWWMKIDRQALAETYPFLSLGETPPRLGVDERYIMLLWSIGFFDSRALHIWNGPIDADIYADPDFHKKKEIYPGVVIISVDS